MNTTKTTHMLRSVLLFTLLAAAFATPAQSIPRYEAGACPFPYAGDDVTCGRLHVPENRADPDSDIISLAVATLLSTGDAPQPDPVIFLDGGPGGSALSGLDDWLVSALRPDYDIILIDQRGTGYSRPSLSCAMEEERLADNAMQTCYERLLGSGVDLGAYNSAQNAADIADLLLVLGIADANIIGSSYGSRLALTLMRDHPRNIRSVVLDAVYPPHVDAYETNAQVQYQAYETLFNGCAADANCNRAYPDLRDEFYSAAQRLDAAPQLFYDGETDMDFDGATLLNFVFNQMYDTTSIPFLPRVIADIAAGDDEALITYYDGVSAAQEEIGRADSAFDAFSDEAADGFDQFMLDALGYDSLDELYAELDALDDEDFFSLVDEAVFAYVDAMSDAQFEDWLMSYFDFADVDELYTYLDVLSDEEYVDVLFELIMLDYEMGASMMPGAGLDDAEAISTPAGIDFSSGMFNSVTCYEEVPFNQLADVRARAGGAPQIIVEYAMDDMQAQLDECRLWNVPRADAIENQPVRSALNTLVLSGQYDPVTPPEWGQAAADFLPNSTHIVFPGIGHSALDVHPCPTQILLDFLADPARTLDVSCADRMSGPQFVTD